MRLFIASLGCEGVYNIGNVMRVDPVKSTLVQGSMAYFERT